MASDVDTKITTLKEYRSDSDIGKHYESFQTMINYEEENKLLKDSKRPSGARTALRLHRALSFFAMFMEELRELADQTGSGAIARECYKKTLAKYHPWYVQKTATFAMYTLPNREQLVDKAFSANGLAEIDAASTPELKSEKASEQMALLAKCSKDVYAAVEKLYTEKSLLDLP